MSPNYPKFKDFAEEEGPLEGKKRKIDEILNTEILIIGYRIGSSKYKNRDYLTLQFINDGNKYIVFTGSDVLMRQIRKYEAKIPFYTKIVRINNYYTMS